VVHGTDDADANDTQCHTATPEADHGAPQRCPGCSQPAPDLRPGGRPRLQGHTRLEVPVLTVAVLVVFFALLTFADLLAGLSGGPGLVAPLR
jgi:hypothetical protein